MLDLVNQETVAVDNAIKRGDEIYSIHNNPADVGLFSKYAKVERVPIEAHTPRRTYGGRQELDIM